MPIVKVYGVPTSICGEPDQRERLLGLCCNAIQIRIAMVRELGITKEQVTVFFPTDLMQTGLGEEIIVEVVGLFKKPDRTAWVRERIAVGVAQEVRTILGDVIPNLKTIEVLVYVFDQSTNGFHRLEVSKES